MCSECADAEREEIREKILNLEAQNLALLERNEKLEFREMELREALVAVIWEVHHGYHEGRQDECDHPHTCGRANAVLAKAPYQRKGDAE